MGGGSGIFCEARNPFLDVRPEILRIAVKKGDEISQGERREGTARSSVRSLHCSTLVLHWHQYNSSTTTLVYYFSSINITFSTIH